MRAIDYAVSDGCDVVNLSLGGGVADEGVRGAIGDAKNAGGLVVRRRRQRGPAADILSGRRSTTWSP